MLTDIQTQAIQRLPRTTQVWQGDLRSLDAIATVQGVDTDLTGVFWVDEGTATPRSIHPCVVNQSQERNDLMLEGLVEAMLSPMQGNPGRPRQVIVCRREYQLYLRGVLQNLNIQVEYRPQLRLLDDILLFLSEHLAQDSRFLPQVQPDDLPEDQILSDFQGLSDLYKQTVSLWRRAPWQYLEENPPIAITLNQWGVKTLQACILGSGEILVGLVLYFSREDFDRLLDDPRDDNAKLLGYDAFYVHFLDEDDISPAVIDQFERHHWPKPNRQTYPDVGRLVKNQGLRPLGRHEVLIVQTALDALNQFLSKQKRRLVSGQTEPITQTITLLHPEDQGKLPVLVEYVPMPLDPVQVKGVRDDLFPDGMSVLFEVLPWALVELLASTARVVRKAPRTLKPTDRGLPVVILALKARAARQICDRLMAENLLGILFSQQVVDGEMVDLTLAATQEGGTYLILDVEDDADHRAEVQHFQGVQQKCGGAHGLIILKESKRKGFNPQDVIGIFQCNGMTQLKLVDIPLE